MLRRAWRVATGLDTGETSVIAEVRSNLESQRGGINNLHTGDQGGGCGKVAWDPRAGWF